VIPHDEDLFYRFCHLFGTLIVLSSDRADAAITIDGVDFGHPPNLLFLSPGQHKLVVRAPNVPDKMRRVEIEVGYRTSVQINFSGGSPDSKIEPKGRPGGSPALRPAPGHKKPAPAMYVLTTKANPWAKMNESTTPSFDQPVGTR